MKEKLNIQEIYLPVQVLLDNGMSPDFYTFLFYVYNKQLDNAYLISGIQRTGVEFLVYDGYIEITKEFREKKLPDDRVISLNEPEVSLTNRGLALFEESDLEKKFDEFWELFPSKVPDGAGGYRILRTEGKDTHEYRETKRKYLTLIKKTGVHDKIMKGLRGYLYQERFKLQYTKGIQVFLNQHIWERYQDVEVKTFKKEKVQGI